MLSFQSGSHLVEKLDFAVVMHVAIDQPGLRRAREYAEKRRDPAGDFHDEQYTASDNLKLT